MKNSLKLLLVTAALGTAPIYAQDAEPADCTAIVASVTNSIEADKSEVLNVVSTQVGATPNCACEIVKAAIVASEASNDLVGQIVETAINAAPGKSSLIAQCATSEAPGALAQINAGVINAGGTPAGGLGGDNPLDFPGDVAGGGVVSGGDQNSGAGAGTGESQGGSGDGTLPPNQSPEVTDPDPVINN